MNTYYLRRFRRMAKSQFRIKSEVDCIWVQELWPEKHVWTNKFSFSYSETYGLIKYFKLLRQEYIRSLVKQERKNRTFKKLLKVVENL